MDIIRHGGMAIVCAFLASANTAIAVGYLMDNEPWAAGLWGVAGLFWVISTGLHATTEYYRGRTDAHMEHLSRSVGRWS